MYFVVATILMDATAHNMGVASRELDTANASATATPCAPKALALLGEINVDINKQLPPQPTTFCSCCCVM